ncbi:hypothetical protein CC78DRAFT_242598 [Lojkania enalia]|uniref:F-box domain-containing protein n=1 Tax=Lojkania enalia TaxID=147567 RepID=A0A9P4TR08_9PLEO|nr:hypothetical protein CC78DRAFT_242598 [Didymosphaeria enalia]
MRATLDNLPYDVMFYIASNLSLDDIIHLSHTCSQLRTHLGENTLCRKIIEDRHPHSKEARLAQNQTISYHEAVQRIYDRRAAFSNAYPFSARTIGQGSGFVFHQGVLCVLHGSIIRVFDVHSSTRLLEFDVSLPVDLLSESSTKTNSEPRISLLYYNDEIIAVFYEKRRRPNDGRILALSTKANPLNGQRLIREVELESYSKLFVRHTARYLYCGTYSGVGDHGHHEWEIRGFSLDSNYPLPCARPLQLEQFFGTDIGSTVSFEIHDGYFYALSNQTSYDVEELDWTSFYHCIRFPLDQPTSDALEFNDRIYRRQHAEGPIHDSWTDLSIQIDECTNEPRIVESRREWHNGTSRQLRTFYISNIKFLEKSNSEESLENDTAGPLLPQDDPYAHLIDSSNNPHYAPSEPRFAKNFHREFGPGCLTTRSFIFARTKFRTYNLSCSSFLDLVEDDRCCSNPAAAPCLRIRIGSRRVAPKDWAPADKSQLLKDKLLGGTLLPDGDGVTFRHSTIKLWPPPASTCACSKRLHNILNPQSDSSSPHSRSIVGSADDRSLVYMVRPNKSYGASDEDAPGTIVIVNFNREAQGSSLPKDSGAEAAWHEDKMEDAISDNHWRWTPGHFAACQRGNCR